MTWLFSIDILEMFMVDFRYYYLLVNVHTGHTRGLSGWPGAPQLTMLVVDLIRKSTSQLVVHIPTTHPFH